MSNVSQGTDRADILLGGYASKQCARRVHNDFDPTISTEPWEPPPELQARFDAGYPGRDPSRVLTPSDCRWPRLA